MRLLSIGLRKHGVCSLWWSTRSRLGAVLHPDESTKAKLLANAEELKALGLTLEEPGEPLQKDGGPRGRNCWLGHPSC